MRALVLSVALVVAQLGHVAVASADDASNEVSAGSTLSATTTPRTAWIADRLGGAWDASDETSLRFELGVTHSYPPDATAAPTDVVAGSVTADRELDAHWSVSATLGFSPQSTTYSSAAIDANLAGGATGGEADVALAAASSMGSVGISGSYATTNDGDDASDTEVSLGVAANRYTSRQEITSIEDAGGEMTTAEVGVRCAASGACSPEELLAALAPKWTHLAQVAVNASVVHTEHRHTDFVLDATYYLYDQDPTRVGYFTLATVGRGNLGTGIGIAPLQWSATPSVTNRWGALMASGSVAYGSYVDAQGYVLTTSLKLQYKLALATDDGSASTRIKLYAKLSASFGIDQDGNTSSAGTAAGGLAFGW